MSVEDVLRRKIQVYKANGNIAAAENAQSILDVGVDAVRATIKAEAFLHDRHPGRKLRLRDSLTPAEQTLSDNPLALTPEGLDSLLHRMMTDPALAAEIANRLRKPSNVSQSRYNLASRHAVREPTLNAAANSIANGLKYHEKNPKDRIVRGKVYARLVITPGTLKNAKLGRTHAFWEERLWNVYSLRYSSGFIVVTDDGSESKVIASFGEVKSAIVKSGWNIIREVE